MVITCSRVWINRVRLPVLVVVNWTGKMKIPPSPCVPENFVSRDGFTRVSLFILHTQAQSINKWNIVYGSSQAAGILLFILVQHPDSTACSICMYDVYGYHFLIEGIGSTEEGGDYSLLCVHRFMTAAVGVHGMNYQFSTAYIM